MSWPSIPVPVDDSRNDYAKDKCADKTHHKGRSYHVATMFLILPTLSCRCLYVALLTVDVWSRFEDARYGLYQ